MEMKMNEKEIGDILEMTSKSLVLRDALKQIKKNIGCKIGSPEMFQKCFDGQHDGMAFCNFDTKSRDCNGVLYVCIMPKTAKPYFIAGYSTESIDAENLKPSDMPYRLDDFLPSVRDEIESCIEPVPSGEMLVIKITLEYEGE